MFHAERKKSTGKKEKDEGMSGMLNESFTFFSSLLVYFFLTQKHTHLFSLLSSALLTMVASLHLINIHAQAEGKQQLTFMNVTMTFRVFTPHQCFHSVNMLS